jgi:RNA polymerase sigma-70 factor (ECF subfamily)
VEIVYRIRKDRAPDRTYFTVDFADPRTREGVIRDIVEPVRRYLARRTDEATADDVLSETLLVVWRRIDDVPEDAVPWAIGVARLQLANAHRAQRRQNRLFVRVATVDPPQALPDHADGDTGYILDAVAKLRPLDAEVVRLWAWEDLTLPQIADALGISVNAATIRLHRARKKLRDELGKTLDEPGHKGVKEGERA